MDCEDDALKLVQYSEENNKILKNIEESVKNNEDNVSKIVQVLEFIAQALDENFKFQQL